MLIEGGEKARDQINTYCHGVNGNVAVWIILMRKEREFTIHSTYWHGSRECLHIYKVLNLEMLL